MLAIAVLAGVLLSSCASASDDPVADFLHTVFAAPAATVPAAHQRRVKSHERGAVQDQIARRVTARIGSQWVATALHVAKIESGFRCNARNGRAVGVFQTTRPESFGVSRVAALTCSGGIEAGISHMQLCLLKGARTSRQMMTCHNTGSPYSRRVERAYRAAFRL